MIPSGMRSSVLARLCRNSLFNTTHPSLARPKSFDLYIRRRHVSKPFPGIEPRDLIQPTFQARLPGKRASQLPLSLVDATSQTRQDGSPDHGSHRDGSKHGKRSTHLLSAVLLGPIYISLALLSGEGLQDRENEANIWANIVSDVVSPPVPAPASEYSDLVDDLHADVQGYNTEDEASEGAEKAPSEAQRWLAHMERYFRMGAYHLGVYFRTEDIVDHGSLALSGDAETWYGASITSKLISVQDDVPPTSLHAQNHDRIPKTPGRFVLAQLAFHDVGTEDYHSPNTITEKEEFRPGKCAGAVLDDFEKRLHEIGASRALLITLDDDTYHTVYWDGRRFVTVLFLEFTPLP